MSGKPAILITGATGVIGQVLTERLLAAHYTVSVVVRNLEKSHRLFSDRVTHVVFDGENFTENLPLCRPDIVIHLASHSTSKDNKASIVTLIDSNILFLSLLLDALRNTPLKLFVNAGSFSEFHQNNGAVDPTYFYSATKTASRFIIDYFSKINDFMFINAVLYTVYGRKGEHKKIMDYMTDAIGSPCPIPMSEGYQILDFVHIDDVIHFYLLLIEKYNTLSSTYHEYHIGTGVGTSIRELAQTVGEITGISPTIAWNAVPSRKRDTLIATADTHNVYNELGWKANVTLESGIHRYMREEGKEYVKSL